MTISKWVNLIFASIVVIAFVISDKALKLLFVNVDQLTDTPILGRYVTLTTLIAVGVAVALTFWLYRKPGVFSYLSEVVAELRKVTWPSMDETKRSTFIVIVFTILLSGYLAIFDQIWKYLTELIITGGA
jgi:preprotein translocase subunit SecE